MLGRTGTVRGRARFHRSVDNPLVTAERWEVVGDRVNVQQFCGLATVSQEAVKKVDGGAELNSYTYIVTRIWTMNG